MANPDAISLETLTYLDAKMADFEKRIDATIDQKLTECTVEIKGLFTAHADKVDAAFDSHTADEMSRYGKILDGEREIRNMVAANRESSDSKHGTLMLEIKGNSAKIDKVIECLESAFTKSDDGKPDYIGHANAHVMQKKDAQANYDLKEYIKKVVLAAAFIAVGSWVAALIWQGVLHGPAK